MIPKFRVWDESIRYMDYRVRVTTTDNYIKVEILDAFSDWRELEKGQYELMQSTGLKDKNGKEIFEGDIVKFYRNLIHINGEVEIYKGHPIIRAYNSLEEYSKDLLYMSVGLYDFMQVEVVGNIHQNIELLANKD